MLGNLIVFSSCFKVKMSRVPSSLSWIWTPLPLLFPLAHEAAVLEPGEDLLDGLGGVGKKGLERDARGEATFLGQEDVFWALSVTGLQFEALIGKYLLELVGLCRLVDSVCREEGRTAR